MCRVTGRLAFVVFSTLWLCSSGKDSSLAADGKVLILGGRGESPSVSQNNGDKLASSKGPDLTGTIYDQVGKPIDGGHVFIYTAAARVGVNPFCPSCYADCRKSATTGADGAFLIPDLDSSLIYRVLVVCEGFRPQFVAQVDPRRGPIRAELIRFDPKQVRPRQLFGGRVLDPEGKPVVGAVVSPCDFNTEAYGGYQPDIVDPLVVTNLRGEFFLQSKSPIKSMTLKVQARGLATRIFRDLPRRDSGQELRLVRGASVTGRVLCDGKPLGNILVGLVQARRTLLDFVGPMQIATDASGRFLFSNVTPGGEGSRLPPYIPANRPPDNQYFVYGIMSSLKSFGSLPAVALTVGVDGTATDVGDLRTVPGHRMSGSITLSDGKPVPPHTRVLVARDQAWDSQIVEVDADGRFVVAGLPTEDYTLNSFIEGYALSPRNACASPVNHGLLQGRVDRDVNGLVILYEPTETVKQSPPDRNNPEFRKLMEEFNVRRTQLIRGVNLASSQ